MSDPEDEVLEGLYRLIAEDWTQLQALRQSTQETLSRLRSRVTQALALGAPGRFIARMTGVPEANVRRWAAEASTDSETAGAA